MHISGVNVGMHISGVITGCTAVLPQGVQRCYPGMYNEVIPRDVQRGYTQGGTGWCIPRERYRVVYTLPYPGVYRTVLNTTLYPTLGTPSLHPAPALVYGRGALGVQR